MTDRIDIVMLGDPHICIGVQVPAGRNPETFYTDQENKLKYIHQYCVENNVRSVVFPGDVLNYKNPSLYTANSINTLLRVFSDLKEGLNVYSIAGNHDLKMSSRDLKLKSVYNILTLSEVIQDIDHLTVNLSDNITLSGIDYNPDKAALLAEVRILNDKLSSDKVNIVVLHEHLLPSGKTLPFGGFLNYETFLEFRNINVIHAGHLHEGYPTQSIGDTHRITFVNPWSLSRLYRGYNVLDGTHTPEMVHLTIEGGEITYKHIEIPHASPKEAFITDTLSDESITEVDLREFVDSLETLSTEGDEVDVETTDTLSELIEHYLDLADMP